MSEGLPPAPQKAMNPALKWGLIGCGGFLLFVLLIVAIAGFLFARKVRQAKAELAAKGLQVDTAHGFRGVAYGMATGVIRSMEPAVLISLPKEDHPAAHKAFADLAAKGSSLTQQDMRDLDTAMQTFNDRIKVHSDAKQPPIDPDAARAFVKDIQAIADRH